MLTICVETGAYAASVFDKVYDAFEQPHIIVSA